MSKTYTSGLLRRTAAPRSEKLRGLNTATTIVSPSSPVTPSAGGLASVGLTVPTGFETENSPLTSDGNIVLKYATGYSLPTDAEQAVWDGAAANSHSHSNKALLGSYNQTNANLSDAVSKKHSHSNKDVLDNIYAGNVEDWDSAANAAHTHDNMSVLNDISSADVDNWDNAASKSHEHDNDDVLDGITSAKVTSWDGAATNSHSHSNKALLDTYDQTNANLSDAVSKKHGHDNISELDLIGDGDVAKWDAAAANATNAVKHDGAANAVHTIVVVPSGSSAGTDANTMYILL